eukprot:COSAG03_NODE_5295_length_1282_cov_34.432798_2_plen_167_part_00
MWSRSERPKIRHRPRACDGAGAVACCGDPTLSGQRDDRPQRLGTASTLECASDPPKPCECRRKHRACRLLVTNANTTCYPPSFGLPVIYDSPLELKPRPWLTNPRAHSNWHWNLNAAKLLQNSLQSCCSFAAEPRAQNKTALNRHRIMIHYASGYSWYTDGRPLIW